VEERGLPGIQDKSRREAFIAQILESIRRVRFVSVVASRDISALRANPASDLFDPIRAAILQRRNGAIDESFWLVFLSVHFGKNRRTGWQLAREVYGGLSGRAKWTWANVVGNPTVFRKWLAGNESRLKGGFGNHRKYQSLSAAKPAGTGAAIESYVRWILAHRSHLNLIQDATKQVGNNKRAVFDYLYRSMKVVVSFGRTARFDYLTMIGKIGLAEIEPGSTYLHGATGPYAGANLLFNGRVDIRTDRRKLDAQLVELGAKLDVGMQVLEDSLCNWQKTPDNFKGFRG
jgi:hypothetical protein